MVPNETYTLRQVVAGRGAPQPIRKDIHKLSDATPWDGKDGEVFIYHSHTTIQLYISKESRTSL